MKGTCLLSSRSTRFPVFKAGAKLNVSLHIDCSFYPERTHTGSSAPFLLLSFVSCFTCRIPSEKYMAQPPKRWRLGYGAMSNQDEWEWLAIDPFQVV